MSDIELVAERSNLWLGVTVENQAAADERIPLLLKCPAAVRFLSIEPLLSRVTLCKWLPTGCAHWQCQRCGAFSHTLCECNFCGASKEYKTGSHVANKRTADGWVNRQPLDLVIVGP